MAFWDIKFQIVGDFILKIIVCRDSLAVGYGNRLLTQYSFCSSFLESIFSNGVHYFFYLAGLRCVGKKALLPSWWLILFRQKLLIWRQRKGNDSFPSVSEEWFSSIISSSLVTAVYSLISVSHFSPFTFHEWCMAN